MGTGYMENGKNVKPQNVKPQRLLRDLWWYPRRSVGGILGASSYFYFFSQKGTFLCMFYACFMYFYVCLCIFYVYVMHYSCIFYVYFIDVYRFVLKN